MGILILSILLFLQTGCDSYSLVGMIEGSTPSPVPVLGVVPPEVPFIPVSLTLANPTMMRGASLDIFTSDGKPPYEVSVFAGEVVTGSGSLLGSISSNSYTNGGAIGKIIIRVTDSDGDMSGATVTVLPQKPTNVTVTYDVPSRKKIYIKWSYVYPGIISGFEIYSSTDFITWTPPINVNNTTFDYTTGDVPKNITYYFKIYAVSGEYRSPVVPLTVKTN